ncbi:MAG: Cof-type HAD-IIB family hydrolase [Dehalococcoidales bacterium]
MTNHPFKLLVADIDGTLINGYGNISIKDKQAMAKARELGLHVSLCTGRGIRASLSVIDQLALDSYHIFFDGAVVSHPGHGEEIYAQAISKAMLRQMIEFAHLNDLDLELFSVTHYFVERETWSTEAHDQFFGVYPTVVDFTNLWERERIVKGGLVTTNPQERTKAGMFRGRFENSLHFSCARTPAYPGVDFINILAPGVSKGKALEALASYLRISIGEVIAVGDGTNDISLLTTAGLSIAMGNAPDEVKAVADYITLDVDHSGLASAVNQFLL